jgi:hypothetical protein
MAKKSPVESTAKGYWHNRDPYKLHSTKKEAEKDYSRLGQTIKKRVPRVSTFYTILQDPRKNNPTKFGRVPQGPHTFPFHAIHNGIIEARTKGPVAFNEFAKKIVPSVADFNSRVSAEISSTHKKRARANIAMEIFAKRHKRFVTLRENTARTEHQDIAFAHVINKLIQMDPHGSYAYKNKGASKNALKGKGESSLLPLANQIDLPSNHGFSNVTLANNRNNTLLSALSSIGIH